MDRQECEGLCESQVENKFLFYIIPKYTLTIEIHIQIRNTHSKLKYTFKIEILKKLKYTLKIEMHIKN